MLSHIKESSRQELDCGNHSPNHQKPRTMAKEWTPKTRIELLLKMRFQTKVKTAEFLGLSKPGLEAHLTDPKKLFKYVDSLAGELKLNVCDFACCLVEKDFKKRKGRK